MKIYTRAGDDGTTGLLYGGRVAKDSELPTAYGTVDEAQAVLGLARAETGEGSELDGLLTGLARDLWVLMAELATDPANHHKLTPGKSRVTAEMVTALEERIDDIGGRFGAPTEFVVPGQNRLSALLDLARTVVRRAERHTLAAVAGSSVGSDGSHAVAYLNRLSDLLWILARWQEDHSLTTRSIGGTA
ncbi:cob(I)yrinic acid a,c-diamide adenosyltransferase [soil metagenome]